MRTKWFKYPKEIPHETGFYTVRGINEECTKFEDDVYWDGNTFKCGDGSESNPEVELIEQD